MESDARAGRMIFMALNVADLDASRRFYADVLGLDLHVHAHEPAGEPGADARESDIWIGGPHAAVSFTDGAFLHFALYPAREPERPVTRNAQLGFRVADPASAHARLQAAGVAVIHGPRDEPWGTTARYRDPDGNVVSLTRG